MRKIESAKAIRRLILFISVLLLLSSPAYSSTVNFYAYDDLEKNVTSLVNSSGNTVITYAYDAFGNIVNQLGEENNTYRYNAEQFDPEPRLIFLRNRYYDPSIGRFISKDVFSGNKMGSQSFNPYVFVVNNPINYIDPLGLKTVIIHGMDLLSTITGGLFKGSQAGYSGELTGELKSLGEDVTEVNWSGNLFNYQEGYDKAFNAIVDAAFQVSQTGEKLNVIGWSLGSGIAADVLRDTGIKADNFITMGSPYVGADRGVNGKWTNIWNPIDLISLPSALSGMSNPNQYEIYAGVPHVNYFNNAASIDRVAQTLGYPSSRLNGGSLFEQFISGSSAYAAEIMPSNFGGVSLSKTATLLTDLTEIRGAFYDEKTGQIIIVGKQNVSLPQMKLDDLAVAVNSVYGGQDPGVSIDPPLVNNTFSVRYDGLTANTEFGSIMFEADRQLKTLTLGKDNITGSPAGSGVSGYKNMLDRYRESKQYPEGNWSNRFWFKPKEVKLVKSQDGSSMVFDTVTMECLTESRFQSGVVSDPQAEAFAQNLSERYDDFANERPIFKDLLRLGKVTSIVKWIKDNDVPIDLSFIRNYTVPAQATPANTPATQVSTQWEEGGVIHTLTITGGVTYTKPNEYQTNNSAVDPLKDAAIAQRPAETDFKWDFNSPQGEVLSAVAESFARSRKDGNFRFSSTDLSYPADCDFPLEFTRYYDSFCDLTSGLGSGWEYRPMQIRFPETKMNFTFGASNLILSLYPQVFVINRSSGQEDAYELLGIDNANLPLYAKSGQPILLREAANGNFILSLPDSAKINFDAQGNLLSLSDKNGKTITYIYQNGKLTTINAGTAGAINISYNQNKIASVAGPGPRTITYGFDANGNLNSITNAENQILSYNYDSDHRVTRVTDPKGNLVFEGTYDDYNRLTSQKINNELEFGRSFTLAQRKTVETDPNLNNATKIYDEKYRVLQRKDHLGNKVNISYASDNGPSKITDAKGQATQYSYDVHGNVSEVTKADGSRIKLYYDANDNMIAIDNPEGADTAYGYDDKNRLIAIYHYASLNFDAQGNLTGWQYDLNNVTTISFDASNGHLLSITDPEGRKRVFENYNANGIPNVVKSTSGFAVTNTYDSLARLKKITDPAGNSIDFDYTGSDQIRSISTQAGTSYFYYDNNNNLTAIKDALGHQTDFDYDAKNNLQGVTDPETGNTGYTYDKFNNLNEVTLPNATKLAYEYDDLNRIVLAASGQGTPLPVIAVLEESLSLGTVPLGSSTSKTLNIYNLGTKDLSITNISADKAVFAPDSGSAMIPAGGELALKITFTPSAEGSVSGNLTINSDDADTPVVTVSLSAIGQLPALMPTAHSTESGVQISWRAAGGPANNFHHYSIYRSEAPISNLNGLTPLAQITNRYTTSYTDNTAAMNVNYYYAVVAFDAAGNRLTAISSYGPVNYLNLGRLGSATDINAGYNESASSLIYNPAAKEYLLIYEANPSGSNNNYDIFGQRISNTGAKIGSPFSILDSGNNERNPRAAYNSASNEYFVAAEADFSGNGTDWHVVYQRISAAGAKIGSWLYFNQKTNKPLLAYNSVNNNYMLLLEYDVNGNGTRWNIATCLLSADGTLLGSNIFGSSDPNLQLHSPSVTFNKVKNEFLCLFEMRIVNRSKNDIYYTRLDAAGLPIGGYYNLTSWINPNNSNILPKGAYNPDRNEYLCVWHFTTPEEKSGLWVARILGAGGNSGLTVYWVPNKNAMSPEVCYFSGHNEYFISFTTNPTGTNGFNVEAQRMAADTLSFITTLDKLIPIADSLSIESNNCAAYSPDKNEFLSGYGFDASGNGSNLDLKLQRLGVLTLDLSVNPASLNFGATFTSKLLQVINSGGAPMLLNASTNQPWLSVSPQNANITGLTADFTVDVSRSGLAPANYLGNVAITFAGGVLNVPVTMAVNPQPPQQPSNPAPADGAVNQRGLDPQLKITLNWQCSDPDTGDSLAYDLYFGDDSGKVNNLDSSCRALNNQAQNSYKTGVLQNSKAYYWKVVAKDTFGLSAVGPLWSFTTSNINVPQIIPYSPDPTNNKKPTLAWNSVFGAAKYHLQISAFENFSSFIINDFDVTATSYAMLQDLPEGKIYWRLSSMDNSGNESDFSGADDFTVQASPPQIPVLTAYSPDPTKEQKPKLCWQAVTDAVSYHIQIDNTGSFNNPIIDRYVTVTGYTPDTNLPEGMIYWRVSARDQAGNESAFSPEDLFRIDITAPEAIAGLTASAACDKITLNWDKFNDSGADFKHFNIYRGNSAIPNVSGLTPIAESITDPSACSFIDTLAVKKNLYYYAVTAEDLLGNENRIVTGIGPASLENSAPVLNPIGNKSAQIGETLSFNISATDPDNDNISYSATNLPQGANFDPEAKVFTWKPASGQKGTYGSIHFEASDGELKASEEITITVTDVNHPPELAAIGNRTVNEGQLLEFLISATDPDDGQTLAYFASGLPQGAYFNANKKIFSWLPNYRQQGTYIIHFEVSDGALVDSEDAQITVINIDPGHPSGQSVGVAVRARVVP